MGNVRHAKLPLVRPLNNVLKAGAMQLSHWDIWMRRLETGVNDLDKATQDAHTGEGEENSSSQNPNRVGANCDTLEALREIGGLYFSLEICRTTKLLDVIQSLKDHQVPAFFAPLVIPGQRNICSQSCNLLCICHTGKFAQSWASCMKSTVEYVSDDVAIIL